MSEEVDVDRRPVKFYGLFDLSTGWEAGRAAEVVRHFEPARPPRRINQVIELHNAALFVENGVFREAPDRELEADLISRIEPIKRTVGGFFNALAEDTLARLDEELRYEYHSDALALFARHKVHRRATPATLLATFDRLDVPLRELVTSPELVTSCDDQLRVRLLDDATSAEILVRRYLEGDQRTRVYLPASLTTGDRRWLIDQYLESADANLNLIRLIELAPVSAESGVDVKAKLKAKRRYDREVLDFFEHHDGMRIGYEVSVTRDQEEPVVVHHDGDDVKVSHSSEWLEQNLDFPTILNNFIYLFEFADGHLLLRLPSFHSELGVFDRFMRVRGVKDYATGASFDFKRTMSALQTSMYLRFLQSREIELESVVAWFFSSYLEEQFGAEHFRFVPSSPASTYLERCRHLFSEMESVAKQYTLYVRDGELDRGLLGVSSEQIRYKQIPGLLDDKYFYPRDHDDIRTILHLLFSDQAGLGYIDETLRARNTAELLLDNDVSYNAFHDHQRREIDYLIEKGVLEKNAGRVVVAGPHQYTVLRGLFDREAVSYHHYSRAARRVIDEMAAKGWLESESTLLSRAEASYFNYNLNQSEFTNGPDLRNKYVHGAHVDVADEAEHFRTYLSALILVVALCIKMCDDLWLRSDLS